VYASKFTVRSPSFIIFLSPESVKIELLTWVVTKNQ